MAWERRKRGGLYYTRTRRVGSKRWAREYIGSGPVAEAIARLDTLEREQRARERAAKAEERRLEAAARTELRAVIFGLLDVLDGQCAALMRAELEAAGYHEHHREWRRRRGEVKHGDD